MNNKNLLLLSSSSRNEINELVTTALQATENWFSLVPTEDIERGYRILNEIIFEKSTIQQQQQQQKGQTKFIPLLQLPDPYQ